MEIQPMKSERDYQHLLKEISELMDAVHNTPEGTKLDALVALAEAWENVHYPIRQEDD